MFALGFKHITHIILLWDYFKIFSIAGESLTCANGLFRLQSVYANNGLINDSGVQLSRTTDLWSAAPLQPSKWICGSLRTGLLHLTVAMANKIKLCVVSNSRRNPSLCRCYYFATESLCSSTVPCAYSTLQYILFLFSGISEGSLFLPVWLEHQLWADTLTDTERRTGDRCTEERSDLGIEIWYHVPGSAEKVSYNAQLFI